MKRRLSLLLALCCAVLMVASQGFSAQIKSSDILIADGVTGQDTQNGEGVKTDHIQDRAVTGDKIDDGAITATKLALGAVTNEKISGTLGVEKVQTYAGTRMVHKGAADNINVFNSINSAINSITDASSTNRYLVIIKPGIYDEKVVAKPFVDIIGSGQQNTIISSSTMPTSLVTCTDFTISNIGISSEVADSISLAKAIVETVFDSNAPGGGTVLENVTVFLTASGAYQHGINLGPTYDENEAVKIINSKIIQSVKSDPYTIGIYGSGYRGLEIINTEIELNSTSTAIGIQLSMYVDPSYFSGNGFDINGLRVKVYSDYSALGIYFNASGYTTIKTSTNVVRNSYISIDCPNSAYPQYAVWRARFTSFINSEIYALTPTGNGMDTGGGHDIINTRIKATQVGVSDGLLPLYIVNSSISGQTSVEGTNAKIANSELIGSFQAAKVTNCFDGNYAPIANQ